MRQVHTPVRGQTIASRQRRGVALRNAIEALEDRRLLTSFFVNFTGQTPTDVPGYMMDIGSAYGDRADRDMLFELAEQYKLEIISIEELIRYRRLREKLVYRIAEADLQLRGPGDLLGEQQSGLPPLAFADLRHDLALVERAREIAKAIG